MGPDEIAPDHDLVFEGYFTATPELLLWDEKADAVRRLLPAGTVVMDPQPSPDGTRVAFVVANYADGTGDIFVMERDGSNVQRLTFASELDDQPAWSPNGQLIAFRSFRTQLLGDIWIMTSSGGTPTNSTPDPLPAVIDESHPSWSPDGAQTSISCLPAAERRLLSRSRVSSACPSGGRAGGGLVVVSHADTHARPDLYALDLAGTTLRPLVTVRVEGGSLNPAFLPRPRYLAGLRSSGIGSPTTWRTSSRYWKLM